MMFFAFGWAFAQGGSQGDGIHSWPDSLVSIEVTGTILVNTTFAHPLYYLDEGDDGDAEYHLSFGPWWYEPESGLTRPVAGEVVTIAGVVQEGDGSLITILVCEVDGELWRLPVEYGLFGYNAEPLWPGDMSDTLRVSGTVYIDTTWYYDHYYLSTDGDTVPEYKLGFGPPSYEPESGAVRPEDGQVVEVFGIVHENDGVDLLTVFELDGLEWRPLGEPAPWAGGWLLRSRTDSTKMYCATNTHTWINFPPNNFGHGGGPAWPDSMFMQFWEVYPDSLPGRFADRTFAGYHVQLQDRDRDRLMDGRFSGENGLMRFELQHQIRIRYYDEDIESRGLLEAGFGLYAWNGGTDDWEEVTAAQIDETNNIVTVVTDELASYYALIAKTGLAVASSPLGEADLVIYPNYPNPTRDATTIQFAVATAQRVVVEVFDLVGRKVATVADESFAAGLNSVTWRVGPVAPGVYVYRVAGETAVRYGELVVVR